jgi:EAL domain-containing protein (putative c-di-GMP-specific phosphodiesterase class I)
LKLDRSIVSGLPEDAKARAVLHATMALARDLGIEVIGEGVETKAQAEALRRAGCTLLQGWLIGRPVPAAVLLEGDQRVPHRATA